MSQHDQAGTDRLNEPDDFTLGGEALLGLDPKSLRAMAASGSRLNQDDAEGILNRRQGAPLDHVLPRHPLD